MLCYFGLSLSAGHLGEDIFLNYELIMYSTIVLTNSNFYNIYRLLIIK